MANFDEFFKFAGRWKLPQKLEAGNPNHVTNPTAYLLRDPTPRSGFQKEVAMSCTNKVCRL